jgi:hypothetical protein
METSEKAQIPQPDKSRLRSGSREIQEAEVWMDNKVNPQP